VRKVFFPAATRFEGVNRVQYGSYNHVFTIVVKGFSFHIGSMVRREVQLTSYERKQLAEVRSLLEGAPGALIGDLAVRFGLSQSRLEKGFKLVYGKSLAGFARSRQLEQAGEILMSSNRKLYDVAVSCGYRDVSSFCRAFKRRFGKTPMEWRRDN
jgi:AraC family transcriptional regulator, transcriptional activator of the genes for pyochelin and ferripyochelin receptors